ncbi:MAG: carbohydrate kinase [Pseudoruegeria sp.]
MVVCCGEALIDMLPRLSTDGEPTYAPYSGGAVFNTSIALGRLGTPSSFVSGLSNDLFGEQLVKSLEASNVDISGSIRSDRPTTLAFVTLIDGQARYAFYDENTAGRLFNINDLPKDPDLTQPHFFGGISLVSEPGATSYEAFMTKVAPHVATMIDPNIRPDFIKDETVFRARLDRMIGLADIVKLSDEDLHWLRGEGDLEILAQELIAAGRKLVCITEGAKGARGVWAGGSCFVPARAVTVADTVGAGDTFNAGLLAGLNQQQLLTKEALSSLTQDQVEKALSLSVQAAAITVSRAGANPPWAHEIA